LILQGGISPGEYDSLPALGAADQIKIDRYSQWVKNFRSEYPLSVGFCVEVQLTGDTGEAYGSKLVVLGHETGAELFIPLAPLVLKWAAIGASAWLGNKTADAAFDLAVKPAVARVLSLLEHKFYMHLYGGVRIDRIEIRTAQKGVLLLPWSMFDLSHLSCLVARFNSIKLLSEVIDSCFASVANSVEFRQSLRPAP
jgi:hypothetical protein